MTHATIARPRTTRPVIELASSRPPLTETFGTQAIRLAKRMLTRLSLATMAFAFINVGGADGALRALASSAVHDNTAVYTSLPRNAAEAAMRKEAPEMVWTVDVDGDGAPDFSNPTHGGVRGIDAFGSGDFGARRDAGKRRHHGVDYVAAVGAAVRAPISGQVSRVGYAYRGVGGYRVVEIVEPDTKLTARVFYVSPTVAVGDEVVAGEEIGAAQDLNRRYPGITNHVHVELRDSRRRLIDAAEQLPSTTVQAQRLAINLPGPG